jgi:hypothetical protein
MSCSGVGSDAKKSVITSKTVRVTVLSIVVSPSWPTHPILLPFLYARWSGEAGWRWWYAWNGRRWRELRPVASHSPDMPSPIIGAPLAAEPKHALSDRMVTVRHSRCTRTHLYNQLPISFHQYSMLRLLSVLSVLLMNRTTCLRWLVFVVRFGGQISTHLFLQTTHRILNLENSYIERKRNPTLSLSQDTPLVIFLKQID